MWTVLSLGFEFLVFCRCLEVNIETLRDRKSYGPVTPGLELSVMRENATGSNWNQCCNSGCSFSFLLTTFVIPLTHESCLFLYYLLCPSSFISSPHPSISQFASILKFMLLAVFLYIVSYIFYKLLSYTRKYSSLGG